VSAPVEPPARPRPLDPLRERQFRWFWIAAFVSNTGGWMQNATIPYVVYQLTGRAGEVGITGFFQYVPFMIMGLIGGTLADRFPRRLLLVVAQVLQAAVAVALWAVVATGSATTLNLSVLAFASGILGGLNTPIWQALVAELVPRELLLGAVTLNSTQFNASRALGPFLAGVVIAAFGAQASFLLNAVSFAAVVVVLFLIRVRSDATRPDGTSALAGIGAAVRHVWHTPAILTCCFAIIAVASLGSPLFSYLPVYGDAEFQVTGVRLGLLLGASGIGAVLVAPPLLNLQHRIPRATLLAAAMATYGLAVIAVGLIPNYAGVIVALMCFGAAYLAIASTINTTIQLLVRDDLRGKVIAIYLMCLTGALPIGLIVWGQCADAFGLRVTTVVAGVLLIVVTLGYGLAGRFSLMAAEDPPPVIDDVEPAVG
jgi:predicted MFS family arabinose efflux permease